jgi:hypothetical protein
MGSFGQTSFKQKISCECTFNVRGGRIIKNHFRRGKNWDMFSDIWDPWDTVDMLAS